MPADDAALGDGQLGGEPEFTPGRLGVVIGLEGRVDFEFGSHAPTIVGLGGGKDVAGQVLGGRRTAGRATHGRVVSARSAGVDQAWVNRQAGSVDDDRIGGNADLEADLGDQAVANHDRRPRQHLVARQDHPNTGDGVRLSLRRLCPGHRGDQ